MKAYQHPRNNPNPNFVFICKYYYLSFLVMGKIKRILSANRSAKGISKFTVRIIKSLTRKYR